jgi:hypothetical protein
MPEKIDSASRNVSPRDAQKGGQGALSEEHPETPLKQDARQTGSIPPRSEITNGLTHAQIALLCGIGQSDPSQATDDQKHDLERLVSEGYVSPIESVAGARFELTGKAIEFLGKRGAGLNEA